MHAPQHRVVQAVDIAGFAAQQIRPEVVIDHGENGAAAEAAGIGVARACRAVAPADRHRHQLEMRVVAVFGVGKDLRQRHAKQPRLNFDD